jgi:hypothetical protein
MVAHQRRRRGARKGQVGQRLDPYCARRCGRANMEPAFDLVPDQRLGHWERREGVKRPCDDGGMFGATRRGPLEERS